GASRVLSTAVVLCAGVCRDCCLRLVYLATGAWRRTCGRLRASVSVVATRALDAGWPQAQRVCAVLRWRFWHFCDGLLLLLLVAGPDGRGLALERAGGDGAGIFAHGLYLPGHPNAASEYRTL